MLNKLTVINDRMLNPEKTRYNILTCPTHEGYQSNLAKTGHNFYMLSGPHIKKWDFHTRPLPSNHFIYSEVVDRLVIRERIDIILCQNRVQQYPLLKHIADKFSLPLIVLDHTEPPPNLRKREWEELSHRRGDYNVFITEHNRNSWHGQDDGIIIPHGINTEVFGDKYSGVRPAGISVVNFFPQRDVFCGWHLWNNIREKIPVDLIGENPGLSESINDANILSDTLAEYRFFLNTSQLSPIPMSMLEAMSVGLPVVTTPKQECGKVIEHGVNGLIGENAEELQDHCQYFIDNPEAAKEMGQAARFTILEKFNMDSFVTNWNNLFDQCYRDWR